MAVKKKVAKKAVKKVAKKKVVKKAAPKKVAKVKKPSQTAVINAMKNVRDLEKKLMAIETKIDKEMEIIDAYFG